MGTISLILPQIGQPDSTEDVKIPNALTTIQNWANGNIDATNIAATSGYLRLAFRNGSSNLTANPGDFVSASASVTVALPSPTSNATVGIQAASGVTGASPVTVSGTHIFGVGLANVSSFTLGVPFASVVLVSDGTNWLVVMGQRDTGWVGLSGVGGISSLTGAYAPAYRIQGNTVRCRGGIQNVSGSAWPTGTAFFTNLPLPAGNVSGMITNNSNGVMPAYVSSTNGLVLLPPSGTLLNSQGALIDQLIYELT